jgi:hypothetical protein
MGSNIVRSHWVYGEDFPNNAPKRTWPKMWKIQCPWKVERESRRVFLPVFFIVYFLAIFVVLYMFAVSVLLLTSVSIFNLVSNRRVYTLLSVSVRLSHSHVFVADRHHYLDDYEHCQHM